jgi:hypothetical protein
MDERVVHNATVLETVVRPLETVAALQRSTRIASDRQVELLQERDISRVLA